MPNSNTREEQYLSRIESLHADLEELKSEYMLKAKDVRTDIKLVYREAREEGIEVKPLKGLVKYRNLERKQQRIAEDFDAEEHAAYQDLIEQLGDLGRAAAKRAGVATQMEAAV